MVGGKKKGYLYTSIFITCPVLFDGGQEWTKRAKFRTMEGYMQTHPQKSIQEILVLGGGFGGVSAALSLARHLPKNSARLLLISEKNYLEYSASLYRVVTGRATAETCLPYSAIFRDFPVEILSDRITAIDPAMRVLTGTSGSTYRYDILIVALGSETTFFGIPGMQKRSFGMKSITEALRLRRHLHEVLQSDPSSPIVIVGGGATGVELAGELAIYAQEIAKKHGHSHTPISINLVEAMPRILPTLPEAFTERVVARLHTLGVHLHLNSRVLEEKEGSLLLSTTSLPSRTVIWTAGVQANTLLRHTEDLAVDQKGRGVVDDYLHAKGHENVFLIGDCAATPFSGMAQTAIQDGKYVAHAILSSLQHRPLLPYTPRPPAYAIPVGPHWAAVLIGPFRVYGRLGWWLRRVADLKVMFLYLPWRKAIAAWLHGEQRCESCEECSPRGR